MHKSCNKNVKKIRMESESLEWKRFNILVQLDQQPGEQCENAYKVIRLKLFLANKMKDWNACNIERKNLSKM